MCGIKNARYYPGKSLLKKGFETAEQGLKEQSRKTALRLAQLGKCVCCNTQIKVGSGDHVIPLSRSGPQSAENFMLLCRRYNASKGNKDLLQWWFKKGKAFNSTES